MERKNKSLCFSPLFKSLYFIVFVSSFPFLSFNVPSFSSSTSDYLHSFQYFIMCVHKMRWVRSKFFKEVIQLRLNHMYLLTKPRAFRKQYYVIRTHLWKYYVSEWRMSSKPGSIPNLCICYSLVPLLYHCGVLCLFFMYAKICLYLRAFVLACPTAWHPLLIMFASMALLFSSLKKYRLLSKTFLRLARLIGNSHLSIWCNLTLF